MKNLNRLNTIRMNHIFKKFLSPYLKYSAKCISYHFNFNYEFPDLFMIKIQDFLNLKLNIQTIIKK